MIRRKNERYWEKKSFNPCGSPATFNNKEELWAAALEYFRWADTTPIYEQKAFHHQGEVVREYVELKRPFTITRFLSFVGLNKSNWSRTYSNNEEFKDVVSAINDIIKEQKFEGAVAGIFNPAIIVRDLGLADKTDHTSSDGTMTPKESKTIVVTKGDIESVLSKI